MRVALAARSERKLQETAEEIRTAGGDSIEVRTDIRERSDVERLVSRTMERWGRLDALVNNASVTWFGKAMDDPADSSVDDLFDDTVATNLRGTWNCIRCAVPHMKARGGGIVSISSVHGHATASGSSAYAMSKGGLVALTRALAIELAPFDIRVNSISPGWIKLEPGARLERQYGKEAAEEFIARFGEAEDEKMKTNQPLRRIGVARDVAACVTFLLSSDAAFITGVDLCIDGGLTAMLAEPCRFDLEEALRISRRSREAERWLESVHRPPE
jgi:NAD(P)-dependent dehydrogenase (short-subunit alcohol dehydrogenase family)